jgi:L-alanine-DL-glutamate epimerase-like enolase superfamily enzyme
MRIVSIDVFTIRYARHYRVGGHENAPGRLPGTDYYVEPQWVHAYSSMTESCLVKITAENGATGWGEAQAPLTPQTPATLITTLLGPALLGQNALATAVLYDRLYYLMGARGHSTSFWIDAIAGLDNALWDLKARHYGAPLFELLGGPFRLKHPAYVSGLRQKTLDERIAAAKGFEKYGFRGVKIFAGGAVEDAELQARAIREAITPDAARLGRCLDQLSAVWFEAPLDAEDMRGHAALARKITTPIAVGEPLRTPRQFEPWLRHRALAIAQPDIMRTGVTGAMRIAALAEAIHVPTALHIGVCTGVGMATTWQAAAALPGAFPQEHQHDLFETANRFLKTKLVEERGELHVPQTPGIGVEVGEEMVAENSTEHWRVDAAGRHLLKGSQ